MIELWGSEKRVDPAPMSGFLKNEARKSGTDKASIVMRSFNSTTLSVCRAGCYVSYQIGIEQVGA